MSDSLCREHCDDRAEQQSQDDLSDQPPSGAQGIEVIAHPDGRIAPGQDQETDRQEGTAEAEYSVLADSPDHGENCGDGDAAADSDSSAAYGRQSMRGTVRGDVDDSRSAQQRKGDEGAENRDHRGHNQDHQRLQSHQRPTPVS